MKVSLFSLTSFLPINKVIGVPNTCCSLILYPQELFEKSKYTLYDSNLFLISLAYAIEFSSSLMIQIAI
ncbi:hypothetical protein IKS57_03180 [bacterium]|nr:hypothetical protein [bacterium]